MNNDDDMKMHFQFPSGEQRPMTVDFKAAKEIQF